jgi:hypothetical protein
LDHVTDHMIYFITSIDEELLSELSAVGYQMAF